MVGWHVRWLFCLAAGFVLAGCTGLIGENEEDNETVCVGSECETLPPDQTCPEPPCETIVDPCTDPTACAPPGEQPVLPSTSSRYVRLTHDQWENTVRDLLHLSARPGISSTFIGDPSSTSFSTNAEVMDVGPELWLDYQRGAESAATIVADDGAILAGLHPALTGDLAADRDGFLNTFGTRAFRRPLTPEELTRYQTIFDRGSELLAGTDAFEDGVVITLQAMFQSPSFVYRTELSDIALDGKIRLNGYEVATRLSYALWNTTPTDELLAAAGNGELDDLEGIHTWIQTMLAAPQARAMVSGFHNELLHTDRYNDISKDAARYPEFAPETPGYMIQEVELLVVDMVFDQLATYGELLTRPRAWVNQNLADIYGLTGTFSDTFEGVDLDPTQRSGLLTRLGFLAHHASALEHDPITRGAFVAIEVACKTVLPPPDNVPPLPSTGGATVRERVNNHTGPGTCGDGCHDVAINPAGFPFENYDALGRYQVLDNGEPIDASSSFSLDGAQVSYQDALEFSAVLAESHQVHACYASNWLEYMYGRPTTARDLPVVAGLAEASRTGEVDIRTMMTALLLSDAFLTRSPDGNE